MFVGIIIYSDSEVWNSGYTPIEMNIPDEFIALNLIGVETTLNKTITQGSTEYYDFKDELNITGHRYAIRWRETPDWIEFWGLKVFVGYKYIEPLYVGWDKDALIDAWDSNNNASLLKVSFNLIDISVIFQDTNRTRNNIEDAYDEDSLFCTLLIPDRDNLNDGYYSARDIVLALLTFRLPSVLTEIHPLLSHLISLVIYTQLSYIFFMLFTTLIHGGG